MPESQDFWYTLARPRRQRPAVNVRARRMLVIMVAMLLYLPAVGISILALISGGHWWGVDAQPTGDQTGAWIVTWSDRGLSTDYNIQVGDKILSADGHIPQSQDEINQAITLQVLSPGDSTPRMVAWNAPNQLDDLLSISWIILGTVSLLLGLLVFLHATDRTLALRFFLLWTAFAIASSLEPATSFGNLFALHVSNSLFTGLAGGLLANFLWLLLFPAAPPASSAHKTQNSQLTADRQIHRSRHRWLPEVPVVTSILAAALYLTALNLKQPDFLRQAILLASALTAIALCLSIFFVLRASLSRQATVSRERARTLLGGMILGLTPLLALTIIPQSLTGQTLVPGTITALGIVALPLSFAYAIVRRDLLRMDSLIRNTALALLTIIGMAIAAVLFAELLNPLPAVPALVMGIIAGALLAPLMLKAARWITEAWLFPQVRRYRKLIASSDGSERTGLDPQSLAGQLVGEVHLAFPVRQVAVFVPEKHTGQLLALPVEPAGTKTEEHAGRPIASRTSSPLQNAPEKLLRYQPLFLDENVSARLRRTGTTLLVAPESKESDSEEEYWQLLVPMRVHGRLVGVLALSRREDDQDYSNTDRQLLRVLAGRRALALDYTLHYAELHEAYKQRQELDAAKDRFILTAHHELRTPLTNVYGYLELLRELGPEGRQSRPNDVALFIERGCEQADELVEQVETLLQAAEVSARSEHLQFTSVLAHEAAQRAIRSLDVKIRQGGFRVYNRIPPDVILHADASALEHILTNLLANSLKYSSEDRRTVIISCKYPQDAMEQGWTIYWASPPPRSEMAAIDLLIRDWGHGIPPATQPQIFERFVRLERDLNSPARGSGLGLAISRELAEAMDGQLGVSSRGLPKEGAFFIVRLPVETPVRTQN